MEASCVEAGPVLKTKASDMHGTEQRSMAAYRWGGCKAGAMLLTALIAALATFTAPAGAAEPTAEQAKFFEQRVRPLLADNCFECHGEDRQRADLRLDSLPELIGGGTSGPAVEPEDPDASLMMLAVSYEDADLQMPPDDPLDEKDVQTLRDWIAMGAPWPGYDREEIELRADESAISAEDRQWWAIQPVDRPDVPDIDTHGWARNPIDRFVYAKLQEEGLEPAEEADRRTLIRRASFDLTGLPPTPEQVEQYLNDDSAQAYENMIDRLLESPHYGERWARHWLDLVRYADSDGWRADHFRPHAWRYRDYVVDSFNEDKPYDQFVKEQLAGDEIAPEDPDAVVATGFFRNGVYEWNQRDAEGQWNEIVDEMTTVTGDVFLGLGMGCAQCHDHKFDPILQEDYYRLRAFIEPVHWRDDVPHATPEQIEKHEQELEPWEEKTADIRRELEELQQDARDAQDAFQVGLFPEEVKAMVAKDAEDRTPYEQQIYEIVYRQVRDKRPRSVNRLSDEEKQRREELQDKLAEYDDEKPASLGQQYTVTDIGPEAPRTTIPGDRRDRNIEPGFLHVLTDGEPVEIERPEKAPDSTGRRTALAEWVADPQNPLTTRVITNRIWHYHFGQGIVPTPSDFGRLGEKPSHPDLLDWLTREYVDNGWTMKRMHRLIMTSATYRQASLREPPQVAQLNDPDNRLLWRFEPRRLDAGQIRDAMLLASGRLSRNLGGSTVGGNSTRRTIYVRIRRNNRQPIRQLFDAPDTLTSAAERLSTVSPTQALLLLNSDWAVQQAEAFASRVQSPEPEDDREIIERLFQHAYNRPPESAEVDGALAFLDEQTGRIADDLAEPDEPVIAEMPNDLGHAAKLKADSDQRKLVIPDSDAFPDGDFTVEAVVQLDSLYSGATVRTIAAQWTSNNADPGWALGVTSKGSAYMPSSLILQLSGKGGGAYDVVASDIKIETGRPYYVAAVVDHDKAGEGGVRFYVRDLSKDDAPLQTAVADHSVTDYRSKVALTVGGRVQQDSHHWDGLVGELRLSDQTLDESDLLINTPGSAGPAAVGFWRFEPDPGFHVDLSSHENHIGDHSYSERERRRQARDGALTDLAHVLLNSNEFLYLD